MPTSNIPSFSAIPAVGPLPSTMTAMVLEAPGHPLVRKTLPLPTPSTLEALIKVIACGICHQSYRRRPART